jgi:DNA processing protein
MINGVKDLFELMNWDLQPAQAVQQTLFTALNEEEANILHYLQQKGRSAIDTIAIDLDVDAGSLSLQLLNLELRNIIRTLPGKNYELV